MIDARTLPDLMDYDPVTGHLTWRHRDTSLFASEHAAKVWNAKYPGTQALGNVKKGRGYLKGLLFGKTYATHRVIWAFVHGEWPPHGIDIDHINGDHSDNRIANLRLATRAENGRNRGPQKGRRFKGVVKEWNRWTARCSVNGQVHLRHGLPTEAAAAAAYNEMSAFLHGEFSRPNVLQAVA